MRLRPRSLKWRTILITLIALLLVIGVVWLLFGARIRFWIDQREKIASLRNDDDPLIRSLARGEIRDGMPVDDLAATHPPEKVIRHDRYVQLNYSNGVSVLAKDGRLGMAVWLGHEVVFFTTLSDREVWGFVAGYLKDVETDLRLRDEQSDWHIFIEDYAHSAVGGVAGYTSTADGFRERAGLPRTNSTKP